MRSSILLLALLASVASAQRTPTGVLVEVHSLEGGPVAGADVWFLDLGRQAPINVALGLDAPPNPVELLMERGTRLETDSKGRVRLPAFRGRGGILARKGDAWAAVRVKQPVYPHLLLRLRPRRELKVQVRSPAGRPRPGALVRLFLTHEFGGVTIWEGAATGKGGVAVIPNLAVLTAYNADVVTEQIGPSVWTACSVGFTNFDQLPQIDPLRPPREPITLTMPDTGSLRLKLRTQDGKPVADEEKLFVTAIGFPGRAPKKLDRNNELSAFFMPNIIKKRSVDGEAIVPFIALGGDVYAQAWSTSRRGALAHVVVKAPEKAGAAVEAVLRVPDPDPLHVVTARVVDGEGKPLPTTSVNVIAAGGSDAWVSGDGFTSATDGDGRLRVEVRATPGRWTYLHLGIIGPKVSEWKTSPPVSLNWDGAEERLLDLGDVPIRKSEPWLSGKVSDSEGGPLAHAEISIREKRRRITDEGPLPRMGSERWFTGWRVSTDADGRWALLGPPTEGSLGIRVSHRGYETALADVEPSKSGKRSHDFVLQRFWTAHLRTTPPVGTDPTGLRIGISGSAAALHGQHNRFKAPDADGWVTFWRLKPGKLQVAVHLGGREKPLRVVEHTIEATPTTTSHLFLPTVNAAKR